MSFTNKKIINIINKCHLHQDDIMLDNYDFFLKNKFFDINDDNICFNIENRLNIDNKFDITKNIEFFNYDFNYSFYIFYILLIVFTFIFLIKYIFY